MEPGRRVEVTAFDSPMPQSEGEPQVGERRNWKLRPDRKRSRIAGRCGTNGPADEEYSVPGTGSPHRDLFHDHLDARRRAAGYEIPIFLEPIECRDVAREGVEHFGLFFSAL